MSDERRPHSQTVYQYCLWHLTGADSNHNVVLTGANSPTHGKLEQRFAAPQSVSRLRFFLLLFTCL